MAKSSEEPQFSKDKEIENIKKDGEHRNYGSRASFLYYQSHRPADRSQPINMFFPGVSAAMSSKSRYSTLEPNSAARSTDLDSDSGELHQFIRKEGGKDESYGRADPLFWNRYFFMLVCAALAIALTAGGVGFHLGRESTGSSSSSTIRVEAKGSKFYQRLSSRPGGG